MASSTKVTVTYNPYLVDLAPNSWAPVVAPSSKGTSNLQNTLQGLLRSPEFCPDGGTLGFGLDRYYTSTFKTEVTDDLRRQSGYGIMLDKITQDPECNNEYEGHERGLVKLGGVPTDETERAVLDRSFRAVDSEGGNEGELITWISPFAERNRLRHYHVSPNPLQGVFAEPPLCRSHRCCYRSWIVKPSARAGFPIYITDLLPPLNVTKGFLSALPNSRKD